ncbi:MAG: hypothetical protein BroJett021_47160 [Chloroflexota bacterium]|jgi:hypothetical protein|nr:hypothetical protein [Caldilinea sp.]GIK75728.1 MAG: hypothetical protein BroJett021_47160 [Chloroflexota bacterium]
MATSTMTNQEALDLIRTFLKAPSDEALMKEVNLNLPRVDGTFFTVLNQSVTQLRREGKPQIADALEKLGDTILRMKTLI